MAKKDDKSELRIAVDALKKDSPELVAEIERQVLEAIGSMSPADFKKQFAGLYGSVVESLAPPAAKKIDGFDLETDDPFAEGAARTYNRLSGSAMRLPFTIGFKDRHFEAVVKNYIVRADGGGDRVRTEKAKKALSARK